MPIRQKPKKWNEEKDTTRYKNVDGYKYDILKQTMVYDYEEMPKFFLADSEKDAEKLFNDFSKILNKLSYSYATLTGLDKSDLFGEALIGLGRASRDFDKGRSDNFKNFAIMKIKDALNEYARKNSLSVSIPNYILLAHRNIEILKKNLEVNHIENIKDLPEENNQVVLLKRAAERANITLDELIERSEFIPSDVEYKEYFDVETPSTIEEDQDRIFKILTVRKLLSLMDETEKKIADGIMEGKSYMEIGAEFGKTDAWVVYKLNKFRERLKVKKEDL
jgi:RNA polymerase sigma factor (sigma-70 family)